MEDEILKKWCDCIFSKIENDKPFCKMCHKIQCDKCSHYITKEIISDYLITWKTYTPLQVLKDLQTK